MESIEADQCFLSAVVQSYLSWSIEWLLMNVTTAHDSTSSGPVQPQAGIAKSSAAPQRLLSVDGGRQLRGLDFNTVIELSAHSTDGGQ
ncbi:MAG: hypothetical protein K5880_02320 [Hydrogenophaga sp.]|uniref:hypothetical protein n=1 Tax=Hydrogenophaga sp. TaxID=1904254 RepID=UPI00260FD989|nr:hypothetical protein [Hydrogenophaga sp.]MCV0437439.1 hypothetical protein [Hydrogenophaga sp.]